MAFPDWLKIIRNKNDQIHIGKVRQESIDTGEMAAGSPSAAARKLARIIEQRDATIKILVVGDGAYSAQLSDYAIKMGQRLDCEIVALSILDEHCQEHSNPVESEKAHFIKASVLGAARFADKASSGGVKFHPLARVGTRQAVIDQVVKEIAGIRYVLTEPDDGITEKHGGFGQLPVLDTGGSKP